MTATASAATSPPNMPPLAPTTSRRRRRSTDALLVAGALTDEVWARRADHHDAFTVTLGWGALAWHPHIADDEATKGGLSTEATAIVDRHAVLDDVPISTDLGRGQSLALVGEHGHAVARSLIVQLAAFTGPADWRLVVVADDPDQWEWCRWLPHNASGTDHACAVVGADDHSGLAAAVARLDDGDGRHVLVVTDRPDALATRTGVLRRYLGTVTSAAVLAIVPAGAVVPPLCRSELRIGSLCTGRWRPDTAAPTQASTVHAAGLSVTSANEVARRLAHLHDPEDPTAAADACPAAVTLSRLFRRVGVACPRRRDRRRRLVAVGERRIAPRAAIGEIARRDRRDRSRGRRAARPRRRHHRFGQERTAAHVRRRRWRSAAAPTT